MELVKTYKYRKCSRNKLSKKQLKELRSKHFIIFERSFQNCMERLNICKAYLNTYEVTKKYSKKRVQRLFEYITTQYPKELLEIGVYTENHYQLLTDKKARNLKISIIK